MKTEYPISNKEYPISKFDLAQAGGLCSVITVF